jgi:hypothetical protein
VEPFPSKAKRGTPLAEIPTDSRSNFEAAAEAKEAHGRRMLASGLLANPTQGATTGGVYLLQTIAPDKPGELLTYF